MAASQNCVGISMAILACGADGALTSNFRVQAVRISVRSRGMASDTGDLLRSVIVYKALYVLMAIDASEFHRAMDRMLKLLAVYKKRHLLAVDVFVERRFAVAYEAVFIFELVLGMRWEDPAQRKDRERTEQDPAGNFHAYEETPDGIWSP